MTTKAETTYNILCMLPVVSQDIDQAAYKPGSVPHLAPEGQNGWATIPLGRPLRTASRDQPGRNAKAHLPTKWAPVPIRSCSRRGLPCQPCRQDRGGLLPHPFTLTSARMRRWFAFCGAIPRVARLWSVSPGGRYPPPCLRGARTFLQKRLLPASGRPAA